MKTTNTPDAPWRRRFWLRVAGTLAACFAAFFMLYGFAVDRYFQAHHLSAQFSMQFDGFAFGLRPELGLEERPLEERYRTIDLYENYAKFGIKLPFVSEGPSNFFFAVGSNLGFVAVGFSFALLALIWFWWMGPRFSLRALLSLVLGLGVWVTSLKLVGHASLESACICAAIPFLAFGASMLVQRATQKPLQNEAQENTVPS